MLNLTTKKVRIIALIGLLAGGLGVGAVSSKAQMLRTGPCVHWMQAHPFDYTYDPFTGDITGTIPCQHRYQRHAFDYFPY